MLRPRFLILPAVGVVLVEASLAYVNCSSAGRKTTVGQGVPAERRVSLDRIDHGAWDALLRKYVGRLETAAAVSKLNMSLGNGGSRE